MAQVHLSEADMADPAIVRSHVHDLTKLGEMKWRYRVVDEGQSPRDEAIKARARACVPQCPTKLVPRAAVATNSQFAVSHPARG